MGFPEITWRAHLRKIFATPNFASTVRETPTPQKQKHCNQGKNIFDFDPCLSLVDTRFVLLFLEFTKKILASVYERLNESSIIPPLENRF